MKEYVVYTQDECANGEMKLVKAKNFKNLLDKHFDFQYDDPEDENPCDDTIAQDFQMWCGENNMVVGIFDLQTKKPIYVM